MARYANRKLRPSSNLGVCGFESLPCYSANAGTAFGRAVGRQSACKADALAGNVGSIPTRGTGSDAEGWITNGSFFQRPGYQVVNLTTRVQLPHEPPVDVD